jgi:hypothetical protein
MRDCHSEDVALLGPPTGCVEHPIVREAFHIVDHAALEDAPLRAYLDRARTSHPN